MINKSIELLENLNVPVFIFDAESNINKTLGPALIELRLLGPCPRGVVRECQEEKKSLCGTVRVSVKMSEQEVPVTASSYSLKKV